MPQVVGALWCRPLWDELGMHQKRTTTFQCVCQDDVPSRFLKPASEIKLELPKKNLSLGEILGLSFKISLSLYTPRLTS